MSSVRAVPMLDELDVPTASELPLEALLALEAKAISALAAIHAGLLANRTTNAGHAADEDRLVGVEEAAQMIGRSTEWVYRNGRELPFVVQERKGCRLRFSAAGIRRYIRERQGLAG